MPDEKALSLSTLSTIRDWVKGKAASIPFGHVDSTSTSTVFTATVDGITALSDGVCCYLTNGVVTSASGFTININNLGAKPVYSSLAAATRSTTIFNINYTMLFVYNSTRVSGGCWDCFYGYDSNTNTIGYQLRTNSGSLPAKQKFYRYRILFTSPDGRYLVPSNTSTSTNATASRTVNQEKIDPFGRILYYNTTAAVEANANPAAAYLTDQIALSLGYSFNTTGAALTLTLWEPVYLKCAPQSDGSAIIDETTPYVQSLPSTEDGKIYIFLGIAYSATQIELMMHHPVYHYKDGMVRQWTNAVTSSTPSSYVPVFCQVTGTDTSGTAGTSVTKVNLSTKSIYNETNSDFTITSGGGVKVNNAGTYRVTGSVYISPASTTYNLGCYIKISDDGSNFDNSTEVVGAMQGMGSNSLSRTIQCGPKIVQITARQNLYLGCRATNAAGTCDPSHDNTYLLIERVS